MTVRLQVEGLPDGALDAIGGGPVLVRDGLPVRQADELFTLGQIARRHPRTAIGQLADGGLLFVVADGRSSWSYGLTMWALARVMADLGAVTAMGLDGGGSSTISFDGQVLNRPSDGRPRRVANGLFLFYYGIYAPTARRHDPLRERRRRRRLEGPRREGRAAFGRSICSCSGRTDRSPGGGRTSSTPAGSAASSRARPCPRAPGAGSSRPPRSGAARRAAWSGSSVSTGRSATCASPASECG